MELIDLTELQNVLQELAVDIREQYKKNLEFNERYTEKGAPSGYQQRLIDSVTTQVVAGDRAYEVTMTLNDYWKYIENDTKPHWPPSNKILEWIRIKPVIPKPDDNTGRIPSQRSLAFLIGRSISKKGTKGSHDLQAAKDGVIPQYKDRIAAALVHDMENYIRKVIAGLKPFHLRREAIMIFQGKIYTWLNPFGKTIMSPWEQLTPSLSESS